MLDKIINYAHYYHIYICSDPWRWREYRRFPTLLYNRCCERGEPRKKCLLCKHTRDPLRSQPAQRNNIIIIMTEIAVSSTL